MAFDWYFQRQGREFGPYSGSQLKELAASGRLEPHDMVRRSDRTDAVPAAKIKGLFPAATPQGRPDASSSPLPTSPQRAPTQAMPTEPPTAHSTSPKAEVRTEAHATTDHGDRIERLQVSDTWKRRFRAIEQDPTKNQLNTAAFIFGPFYYAYKGLWKKGLVLALLGMVVSTVIELVVHGFGWALPTGSLWIPAGAICGMMANRDVYRKALLGETFWPQLGLIESPGKIMGLAIVVFVITNSLSVPSSPGPTLPEMGSPEATSLAESDGPPVGPNEESRSADAAGVPATQSPVISTSAVPDEGDDQRSTATTNPDDEPPSEVEIIRLLATTVAATVAQSDDWQDTSPEGFNLLMRQAAEALGAGNSPRTRGLLEIKPTGTEIKHNLLQVQYGTRMARVRAVFNPDSRRLIGVMVQGKMYTPIGVIEDK